MDLISIALAKKEIKKVLTEGISVSNIEVRDRELTFNLSDGSSIKADGKIPASDTEALQTLESIIQDVKENTVSSQGGTVEGPLTLQSEPTEDLHAITKAYLEKIIGDIGADITVIEYVDNKVDSINQKIDDIDKKIESEHAVVNAETHFQFPSVGKPNVLYKAEQEKLIYQWNPTQLKYEILNEIQTKVEDIILIHGGNANGNT